MIDANLPEDESSRPNDPQTVAGSRQQGTSESGMRAPSLQLICLLRAGKRSAKRWLKARRAAWVRNFRSFTHQDFKRLLSRLGIERGDVLLVHSSYRGFDGFQGNAADVILALEEAVGQKGTVLMPTMPFAGSAVDYVSRNPVFDVNATPSRMGLLTELFRRSPGVL